MHGKEVQNPDPAIRMFVLCENMKWAHLPVAGGIYDQSPELIDKFMILFQTRNKKEAADHRKREFELKQSQNNKRGVAGMRRR